MSAIPETRNALDAEVNTLCEDMDEDCPEVTCKLTCWLLDPERGVCPYLTAPR